MLGPTCQCSPPKAGEQLIKMKIAWSDSLRTKKRISPTGWIVAIYLMSYFQNFNLCHWVSLVDTKRIKIDSNDPNVYPGQVVCRWKEREDITMIVFADFLNFSAALARRSRLCKYFLHHLATTALSTNDFNCQLCWALLWKSFIWDRNSHRVSPFLNLSLSCNFSDCCSFWSLCRNAAENVKKGFSLTDQPREMTISLSLSPSLSLSIVLPLSLPSSVFFFRSFWQRLSINVSFSLIFKVNHRRVCLSFLLVC